MLDMAQPNLYEEDDDDFLEFAALIAFPRRPQIYRQRPDHFTIWRENEFFDRFRMSKNTVRFILHLIENRIRSPTDWYVIHVGTLFFIFWVMHQCFILLLNLQELCCYTRAKAVIHITILCDWKHVICLWRLP